MTRAVATALTEARSLIERGWVRHHYAVDARGEGVHPTDPSAVAFCAVGALDATIGVGSDAYLEAIGALSAATRDGIVAFNDTHTKEEVLGVFDKAIESVGVSA
jgi:hypothetical protein